VLLPLFYTAVLLFFFFSSRRRHTRFSRDWSSDVCSSDLRGDAQLLLDPPDLKAQPLPEVGVQGRQGLVQEQGLGLRRQGPGQRRPLLLPGGELVRAAVAQ